MPAIWSPRKGSPEAIEHWARIRAQWPARPAELHPPPSLAEQADRQIARLNREIAEWEEIKRGAT